MAKVSPSTIQGAYASTSELNANFAALAAEFENCVSMDGTSPSAMLAALDMNGHPILNAGSLSTATEQIEFTGDLDDLATSFIYIIDAAVVTNEPSTMTGTGTIHTYVGTVTSVDRRYQLIQTLDSVYVRSWASATWTSWVEVFDSKLLGFEPTGLHTVYASDLDTIAVNSRYSFIASGVTNEPSGMVSTEYGVVETLARDGNDLIQKIHGQSGTSVNKVWSRVNTAGTWGSWALVVDPAGGSAHPANAFFLMGA